LRNESKREGELRDSIHSLNHQSEASNTVHAMEKGVSGWRYCWAKCPGRGTSHRDRAQSTHAERNSRMPIAASMHVADVAVSRVYNIFSFSLRILHCMTEPPGARVRNQLNTEASHAGQYTLKNGAESHPNRCHRGAGCVHSDGSPVIARARAGKRRHDILGVGPSPDGILLQGGNDNRWLSMVLNWVWK